MFVWSMPPKIGWYAYAWAAEPFVVSAMATYVPLLLEQMARNNAVWAVDHRTPCIQAPNDSPGIVPIPLPPSPKCVVWLLWGWVDTSSLPLYTFSLAVVAQTLLVVSISGIADRTQHRTPLLVFFAVIGAVSTLLLAFVHRSQYYVAALFSVIANASFGAVSVIGNAYLPSLAAHEERRLARWRQTNFDRFYGAMDQVEPSEVSEGGVAATISGTGAAVGYSSALIVQIITMAWLAVKGEKVLTNAIGLVGVWWLVFQVPVCVWLRDTRDRSALALDADEESHSIIDSALQGWKSLYTTATNVCELQDVSLFLAGWFLLSDAVTTINSTAVLFARANLGMAAPAVALVGLVTVIFAIVGSLVAGRAVYRQEKSANAGALVTIALLGAVIPVYGVAGFFLPWLGLHHAWEMYILAAWYGIVLGALNAVCRSLFSMLIPPGREATFFALYAVTDKGSSVLGPAMTAVITDHTHNIRYTFYFLLFMMIGASILFSKVNIRRGKRDAERTTIALNES